MKKLLTVFALTSFTAVFSQITITSNLPSNINAGASIDAEVKINKGTVGNFAKYQMDVPTGYAVTAVEVKSGNFTFENQRAKIVWVSVPSDPEFIVKFKIQANSDAANPGTFSQKFYYLENNEKKEVDGGVNVITIGGGGAVAVNTTTETKPVETKVVETVVTETKPVETKVVETVVTETKPVETKVTETKPVETKKVETVTSTKTTNTTTTARVNSSASEAGMTFRVQLGAFTTEPSKNKFASAGSVKIDLIDGMYKVTTGNFNSKEEAIKHRDQLQAKGFSGFIAKYKDGKRVN
jgi:cell division septation protein DedD